MARSVSSSSPAGLRLCLCLPAVLFSVVRKRFLFLSPFVSALCFGLSVYFGLLFFFPLCVLFHESLLLYPQICFTSFPFALPNVPFQYFTLPQSSLFICPCCLLIVKTLEYVFEQKPWSSILLSGNM